MAQRSRPYSSAQHRPNPSEATADSSENLSPSPFDNFVTKMLTALDLERKAQSRGGNRRTTLRDGERVEQAGDHWIYRFPNDGSVKVKEDTPVTAAVRGSDVAGTVIANEPDAVRIAFEADLGEFLPSIELSDSPTFLLDSLMTRLREKHQSGLLETRMTGLLRGQGEPEIAAGTVAIERGKLDESQWEAVRLAQGSELLFLWGPPGTGKTSTLAAAVQSLYLSGKRVLVVSNTNKAVDSFLLPFCERLDAAKDAGLDDGLVLRVGDIVTDELAHRCREKIQLDAIVARKSGPLTGERQKLLAAREALRPAIAALRQQSEVLKEIAQKESEVREIEKRLRNVNRTESLFGSLWSGGSGKERKTPGDLRLERDTAELKQLRDRISELRAMLPADDRNLEKRVKEELARLLTVDEQTTARIGEIDQELRELRLRVQQECRVCAATASMIHLRPETFGEYDVVVVDEASMLYLPVVLYAATFSKASVIIAGDFRQLPPVVQLDGKDPEVIEAKKLLERDAFFHSGIVDALRRRKTPRKLVQLTMQYRMEPEICALISDRFYGGRLKTGRGRSGKSYPAPLREPVTILDTSALAPFATKPADGSRLNYRHAQVIHAMVDKLAGIGWLKSSSQLGIITPYRPQHELISAMLANVKPFAPECGTVHQFQGNERDLIIFDLVESAGMAVSQFFRCSDITDDGARMLNVGVSRARDRLVLVANLEQLKTSLPADSLYHEFLFARNLPRVCAKELMAGTEAGVLEGFRVKNDRLDAPATSAVRIVTQPEIMPLSFSDIQRARQHVLIISAFATLSGVHRYLPLLEAKVRQACRVRVILGAPTRGSAIPATEVREVVKQLQSAGVVVDVRDAIHDKWIVADDVIWGGSANPLSFTGQKTESMIRSVNASLLPQLARSQIYRHRVPRGQPSDEYRSALLEALFKAENPCCPSCSSLTVLNPLAKGGPEFRCAGQCGWRSLVNVFREAPAAKLSVVGSATDTVIGKTAQEAKICECGQPMKKRAGKKGEFWGCSNFPACRRTQPV